MIFLGLKFWPKGIKDTGIFWGSEKNTDFFGCCTSFSSAQINNKISAIYWWCGNILGMIKKSSDFFG